MAIKDLFFIHGNGQSAKCAPTGFNSINMPGHGQHNWNSSLYSMNLITDFYTNTIPQNSTVFGHSLGGHIAINVALARPDLSVICFGMVPLQSPEQIGTLMLIPNEFPPFLSPNRTTQDIINFVRLSSSGNMKVEELLVDSVVAQDPKFNKALFTTGISNYDWNEIEKIIRLGNRFKLILSCNEVVYNFEQACELEIPIIIDNYTSHSPWLHDSEWVKKFIPN